MRENLAELAIESWRLSKAFESLLSKSDPIEQRKHQGKLSWFNKKLFKTLEEADLKIINLVDQPYEIGAAVNPININEFMQTDELEIEQMIEPIVMWNEKVLRTGTVLLRKRISQ